MFCCIIHILLDCNFLSHSNQSPMRYSYRLYKEQFIHSIYSIRECDASCKSNEEKNTDFLLWNLWKDLDTKTDPHFSTMSTGVELRRTIHLFSSKTTDFYLKWFNQWSGFQCVTFCHWSFFFSERRLPVWEHMCSSWWALASIGTLTLLQFPLVERSEGVLLLHCFLSSDILIM